MIRSELIAILARRFPQFTHEDTELAVKAILDGIAEALVQNSRSISVLRLQHFTETSGSIFSSLPPSQV